jgi:sugar lactone lactonase YvrE
VKDPNMKKNPLPMMAIALLCCLGGTARAQSLPPIFDATPVVLRPAETMAELPKNTFLENLVFDARGHAYVTSHEDGVIWRWQSGGKLTRFAQVPGKLAGIALGPKGDVITSGAGKDGLAVIFRISAAGSVETALALPEAMFLNGMTLLDGQRYLVADSYKGVIWLVDLAAKTADVWLADALLARADDKNPIPGVNGIKRAGSRLVVSNTGKQLLIEVPIDAQGRAGTPRVLREHINIDDFALDTDGTLYGATHVYNSVVRVAPDGRVEVIASAAQGVAGSTAVAFGRAKGDTRHLYVTTNGGMFLPPPTGVEPGRLVRISLKPR